MKEPVNYELTRILNDSIKSSGLEGKKISPEDVFDWVDRLFDFLSNLDPAIVCFLMNLVDALVARTSTPIDNLMWKIIRNMILKHLDLEC